MKGAFANNPNTKRLYNFKERVSDFDLGWADFRARFYLGMGDGVPRFLGIDPLTEAYSFQSSYVYAANNPISNIDIFGMAAASTQELINYVWEKTPSDGKFHSYDNDGNKTDEKGKEIVAINSLEIDNRFDDLHLKGFTKDLNSLPYNRLLKNGGGPPWEYNGKLYDTKESLLMAIFVDESFNQLGIKDLVATAGVIAGQPLLKKRFVTPGSSSGTSILSKYLSPRMGTSKMRLPTFVANRGRVGIAWTKSIGKFTSRAIPFLGWGILAYDTGIITYNTYTKYNAIINE